MILNKRDLDGFNFYELYISCPKCIDIGIVSNSIFATHKNCGGRIYIGDNAHYLCLECDSTSPAFNWRIECQCENSDQIEFTETDNREFSRWHISIAGQLVSKTGVAWLQRFLQNIGNFK